MSKSDKTIFFKNYSHRFFFPHKALNYLKHQQVEHRFKEQKLGADNHTPPGADYLVRHHELQTMIGKTLDILPERRRLIFTLSRQHEMSYKEIASMLDISVKTVETQMGRTLKFLRERLSDFLFIFL